MRYPGLFLLYVLWSVTAAFAETRTETFDCANSTTSISCVYTWAKDPFTGSGNLGINTNTVRSENAGLVQDMPRLAVDLGTATVTMTAVVTVAQPTAGSNLIGPAVHVNAAAIQSLCGCAVLVNSSGQEFLRAAELDAGALTQTSCGIIYTAGTAATVQTEMTAGSSTLLCTYDPGGANEQTCSATCDIPETNFAGMYVNQSSGGSIGHITIDTPTVVTPDTALGGQVFQW